MQSVLKVKDETCCSISDSQNWFFRWRMWFTTLPQDREGKPTFTYTNLDCTVIRNNNFHAFSENWLCEKSWFMIHESCPNCRFFPWLIFCWERNGDWWSYQTKASVWLTHQYCSLLAFLSHLLLQVLTSTCLHLQVWDQIFAELWLLHFSSNTSTQVFMFIEWVDTQWQCASVILCPAHFSVTFSIILSVLSVFIQKSDIFLVCKFLDMIYIPKQDKSFDLLMFPTKLWEPQCWQVPNE